MVYDINIDQSKCADLIPKLKQYQHKEMLEQLLQKKKVNISGVKCAHLKALVEPNPTELDRLGERLSLL